MSTTQTESRNGTTSMDVNQEIEDLKKAMEVQVATEAGAHATAAAVQVGAQTTQAAATAGLTASVVAGAAGLVVGMFLAIALTATRS